jgi:hypothetical protein
MAKASNADYGKKTSKMRSASKIQSSVFLTPRRRAGMLANLEKGADGTQRQGLSIHEEAPSRQPGHCG